MTTVSLPTYFPVEEQSFALEGHVSIFESPLSRATQQQVRGGSRWQSDVTLAPMTMASARPILSWLEDVQAHGYFFKLGDVEAATPQGVATGSPVLHGAQQTGSTLTTRGWIASTSDILKAGDFIQIGDELKRVVSDVASDTSGEAQINITPPLRGSYADGTSLELLDTGALMRLRDNNQARYESGANGTVQIRLSAVEVL